MKKASAPTTPSTRSRWCRAGLVILRDQGPQAVTLDRLCVAMRRTKGAFYHHFGDIGSFHDALLEEWEELQTSGPIAASSSERVPDRRSALLKVAVVGLDHALDRTVRAWGLHDARVRKAVGRVDARRIEYLAALNRERSRRDPARLAELEYAAFLGAQELGLVDDPVRGARLGHLLRTALDWLGGR